MKIISFRGGLGNQVFEYLFYLYLKEMSHEECIYGYYNHANSHNGLEISKWFEVCLPKQPWYISPIRKFIYLLKKIKMHNGVINEHNIRMNAILYEGWWQDRCYYEHNIGSLRFKDFPITLRNATLRDKMKLEDSVAIHIRRGDYLLPKYAPIYANICTQEYYNKALNIIRNRLNNPSFYIFSNDQEWSKENLKIEDACYIDWNMGNDAFYDMYLMSCCKHHIIANSSFSLIGALMASEKDGINICPSKWVNDGFFSPNIQPTNWIKI